VLLLQDLADDPLAEFAVLVGGDAEQAGGLAIGAVATATGRATAARVLGALLGAGEARPGGRHGPRGFHGPVDAP
jgi:hypothetical protein